jgi:hypothetical protein
VLLRVSDNKKLQPHELHMRSGMPSGHSFQLCVNRDVYSYPWYNDRPLHSVNFLER